jgi:ATP-dependent Clp protease, protease subunit
MSRYQKEVQYKDIATVLLESRIIKLTGKVDFEAADWLTSALLALDEDSHKPIQLFILSPGGSVHAGLAIIDVMNHIKSPIYTVGMGLMASMGAAILSAGQKGHRIMLPSASVMLHQVSGGEDGNVQDMRVSMAYTEDLNKLLIDMIAKNCGKTFKEVEDDTIRDKWMFAKEALKYGIIDEIAKPEGKEKEKVSK